MEDTTGGILQDSSAYNHDSINGLGGTTVVPGKYGNALQFDGTDQVQIASAADLKKTTAFTIEAAFRVDGLTNGDWVRVVGKGTSTYRNYGLWYNPYHSSHGGSVFLFQMYGASAYMDVYLVKTGLSIETNRWYHMAGVYTGSWMGLYLDGVLVASSSTSSAPYTSDDPLTIGGADFHTKHVGLIDNVALFGSALSATDIQQHALGLDIAVPEPSVFILFALGMLCMLYSKKISTPIKKPLRNLRGLPNAA